jgi:peptide deformylase
VLQHEFDHLRGMLFIDRLPWYRRWWLRTRHSRVACG